MLIESFLEALFEFLEYSLGALGLECLEPCFSKRSTLTALISRTNYDPELLYTSLESPNMQLFGAPMIEGVTLQTNLPHPF